MKVLVFDHEGSKEIYDGADTIDTDGEVLWVKKGGAVVSVYAPGKWINADIVADE